MGSVGIRFTGAGRDLASILIATLAFAILSAHFELCETVLAWTRPHERFQLDELPGILLFLALGLSWHAWRRVREVRAELRHRHVIEAQLREALHQNRLLAQAGVRAQEHERRVLARELHDELGQYVNAIKIDAVCLRNGSDGRASPVRDIALSIIRMTDHLQVVVRDIVQRLRPPGLDELGLSAAMEDCIEGWRRRLPAVEIRMEVSGDLARLDESTSITLYRLVQEGLTNVARHACASRVHILMQQRTAGTTDQPEVVLTMRDDGRGSKTSAPHAGLGLVGMRERVEALAGRFDVTSAPGTGFGFTARLPVVQLTA